MEARAFIILSRIKKPDKLSDEVKGAKIYTKLSYLLQEEHLANGNKIIYTWDEKNRTILLIQTTDPSGKKIYAEAHFHRHGKRKKGKHGVYYYDASNFEVETSDGRTLTYRYFSEGEKEKKIWYLHEVAAPDSAHEILHYAEGEKRILHAVSLDNSRLLQIGYNDEKNVKTLASPVGKDGHTLVTHTFTYAPEARKTTVNDIEGIPTHYSWNEGLQLEKIARPNNTTLFAWDASNLICRAFLVETPLHATRYTYDPQGNVIEEKFYGNLTGHGSPLSLDSQNLPEENGVETYSKKFTYNDRNLLVRKEEENGLLISYEYLPDASLLAAELSPQRRKFYEYNEDHILIREITDDGESPDRNNLSGVTFRLVKEIIPYPKRPYLNMPYIITEKTGDGTLLKKTVLHYTTGGRIAKKEIYDALNTLVYTLNFTYDDKGRLIEETNALGQIAEYKYDEIGNKTYFKDFGSKAPFHYSYDCSNRLIESSQNVRTTRHSYDIKHNRISTIDHHGYETRTIYDPYGHPIQTHLPNGSTTSSTYDGAGRVTSSTDAKGYTTYTTYNAYNQPTHIHHPNNTEEAFLYNRDGTLNTHTDQNGAETSYTYDLYGRTLSKTIIFKKETLSIETWHYNGFHLLSKTDAEGTITTYEYDQAGRKIAEECTGERTEYSYDFLGRLHQVKTGELLTITEHDLLDRMIEERKEDLSGHLLSYIYYTYDPAGNQSAITRYIQGQPARETFCYDPFNRLVEKTDPLGNRTSIHYDDNLHQKTTIDPLGLHTIETYDSHYNLSTLEKRSTKLLLQEHFTYDANDNLIFKESNGITTEWEYGPLDQLLTLIEPEQKITHYTYTPKGLLHQIAKPSGIVLTNTYNALGHLLCKTSSDGTIHYTYEYNHLGQLLHSHDSLTGTTLHRTYDPHGRLLTETLPAHLTFRNQYDNQGRRIRLELPDHTSITYTYDPLYLRAITRPPYTHTYLDYDLSGNLLSEQLITGDSLNHTYDLAGRHTSSTSKYFSQSVEFDPVGNILHSRYQNEHLNFAYDDLYQLTSEKDHTYSYDAHYNRHSKDSTIYQVNNLNQISLFTYDQDGNPLTSPSADYTYDALDRLISAETPTHRLTFTYDSFHRRLTKTVLSKLTYESQTETYLYDGQNEIGTSNLELRILGRTPHAEIGSAVIFEIQNKTLVPLHDLYGNVAALVSNGSTEYHQYTAFGESKTTPTPWGFSSKRLDEETGLIYFGRRYYEPAFGRWLTPDPLGLDAGPNLYAFVSNAPLTHFDDYGLFGMYKDQLFREMNWQTPTPYEYKQRGIGFLHGIGEFGLNAASTLSHIGYGLTMPFRSINWMFGRSSFTEDWRSFQSSNQALLETGEYWMQRFLPGDRGNSYRSSRSITSVGLDVTTIGLGAAAIIEKSATALTMKLIKQPIQASRILQPKNIQLNRFHQAARNLSETGQNNIRILRGWAKSKGWEKFPSTNGAPEKWGTWKNGIPEWNLRIKPEPGFRPELELGSMRPRFDARLGNQPPYEYINPFTGTLGSKNIGTHIPLE